MNIAAAMGNSSRRWCEMNIGLVIAAVLFVALVLFLLMRKQAPPAQARKSRPRVKREALPKQGQESPSEQKDKNKDMEVLRETIQAGLKTIFSGASTEQADGPLPSTKYEISLDVYRAVKEGFVDIKEFSSVYEISTLLDDPQVDLSRIAKIISIDPILSNKILRTVNSAYFGSGRNVDSVNHALALLGFVNIKTILFQNVLSKKIIWPRPCGTIRSRLPSVPCIFPRPSRGFTRADCIRWACCTMSGNSSVPNWPR
jgi:hypothetical protein